MGQVLIPNLDDRIIESLKLKAELKGHSLEHELRDILKAAVPVTPRERVALSRKIRGMQSKSAKLDSTDLIRAARDTR
jgi:plasmid stability protein